MCGILGILLADEDQYVRILDWFQASFHGIKQGRIVSSFLSFFMCAGQPNDL